MAKGKWILRMATNTEVIGSMTLGPVKVCVFMLMVIVVREDIHKSFIILLSFAVYGVDILFK